jgi:hypothetical protein
MSSTLPRHQIRLPPHKAPLAAPQVALRALRAGALTPVFWARGKRAGVPGLDFRRECLGLGLRALAAPPSPRLLRLAYELLVIPIDSTRHYELGFVWSAIKDTEPRRYADVSSPRCLPLVVLRHWPRLAADLVNPDARDLEDTRRLARAAGLAGRAGFHATTIAGAPMGAGQYDLVTSISVIEHIPDDRDAVRRTWDLVAKGGRLFVTVPCRRAWREERIDVDHYGVVERGEDGFYFHQWVYDEGLLEDRFFSATGRPRRLELWGERDDGALRRRLDRQWSDPHYPFWEEPASIAADFQKYGSFAELPGEGVCLMEFVKD